ncbi:MAG: excinuclease ABC subunit UvrA [Candidatus Neomarinimicrobiota bacterium]|nr:excinuclease ABC subunit UvrA [Candidatus Neomarinimicrobiota bacterium]
MKKNINTHNENNIYVKGAREHNLQNIDVKIPRDKFVVITGLSGSGKSSLAFDTIYAEGQRRYVESLSAYARQFLGLMEKPDVDYIEGLSPAISIEQKTSSRNPRSTVGTITEIYDYLRLLFARIGNQNCYSCGGPVERQTVQQIVDNILLFKKNTKFQILAPVIRGRKGQFKDVLSSISKEGFIRVRIDGKEVNLSDEIKLTKNKKHFIEVIVDRLIIKENVKDRLTNSVELALKIGNGLVLINKLGDKEYLYSELFSCPKCDISFDELQPRAFSFNSPFGACETCDGIGTKVSIDPDLVVPDKNKSLVQGCIVPIGEQPRGNWYSSILKTLAFHYDFNFTTAWKDLKENVKDVLLFGTGSNQLMTMSYSSEKFKGEYKGSFEGIVPNLERRYSQTNSSRMQEWIEKFMAVQDCQDCNGTRLKKTTLAVTINKKNIDFLTKETIGDLLNFFNNLSLSKRKNEIAEQIIKEIKSRLSFLVNVGLDYITMNRSANTLSGGESQRIRLATQIGSQLMGVLYVLDEPTIGLHQRDNEKLIKTLHHLRDLGNSIIVVEHDENTIMASDWVVDMGPKAGNQGGKVVAADTPKNIMKNSKSLTGKYLSGKETLKIKSKLNDGNGKYLILSGAKGNNLKNISVKFPLGKFISITGVSGSGKSTLINQTLFPLISKELYSSTKKPLEFSSINGLLYIDKIVDINQSPIGRTPRSNPATYTGLFTHIRDLFCQIPESKIRGYKPGRFSFNVKGGRCESCQGAGLIKIEMHFLADMYVQCEECKGLRYNRETLEIKYKGKTISEVLDLTISDASLFFANHIQIKRKLDTLNNVGLGYIRLGQQATTLSGGESQRVKLATELSKAATGRTLFLLDEPTTGLHFQDVQMLLDVLQNLVKKGNTVIVIEHNLDVIRSSDWIIDLGPEGGIKGGEIIAEGTPQDISMIKKSFTGKYLKKYFKN